MCRWTHKNKASPTGGGALFSGGKNMETKEKRAVLFAVLAGCMWGSIGLFVHKLGTYGISSVPLTVGRFIISSVLVGIFLILKRKSLLKIRLVDLPWFIVTGVFCLLLFNVSYGIAIEKSSMPVAAVLLYTSPAIVTVFSAAIFREKLTLRRVIAVFLAFTGCALVSGIMSGILAYPVQAYLWGFTAATGYASYSIAGGVLLKRYHAVTVLFYSFLMAAVGGCFLIDLRELLLTVTASPAVGLWFTGAAFVCNVCSYLCYNLALKNMEASRVAVVASIEPAVACALGVVVLKEPMDVFGAIGVVCILGAIMILNGTKRREDHER